MTVVGIAGYPTGIKISKSEIEVLNIRRADFHRDWNYTLLPIPDNASVNCANLDRVRRKPFEKTQTTGGLHGF